MSSFVPKRALDLAALSAGLPAAVLLSPAQAYADRTLKKKPFSSILIHRPSAVLTWLYRP